MKNVLFSLLFLLLSNTLVANVSAATLTLSNQFGGNVTTAGPDIMVKGKGTGAFKTIPFVGIKIPLPSLWRLNVSDDAAVDFVFSGTNLNFVSVLTNLKTSFKFNFSDSFSTILTAGNYRLAILPNRPNVPYDVTISTPKDTVVPIPAAIWLFTSALMGLAVMRHRKA
jgi:hypothetical protein